MAAAFSFYKVNYTQAPPPHPFTQRGGKKKKEKIKKKKKKKKGCSEWHELWFGVTQEWISEARGQIDDTCNAEHTCQAQSVSTCRFSPYKRLFVEISEVQWLKKDGNRVWVPGVLKNGFAALLRWVNQLERRTNRNIKKVIYNWGWNAGAGR